MPAPSGPRWILCVGQSLYGALPLFSREVAAGLAALGKRAEVWDFTASDLEQRLTTLGSDRPEVLLGFNAVGAKTMTVEGDNLLARLGLPFLGVLVDHPVYVSARLQTPFPGYQVTCVDRTHVDFVRAYHPALPASFLPHGACQPQGPAPARRDIDLLFTGSYEDPAHIARQWQSGSPRTIKLFEQIVQTNLTRPEVGFFQHVGDCCRALGIADELLASPEMRGEFAKAETYVRARWREDFLLALDRAGLTADVYGLRWESFPHATRHRFHASVPFEESIALARRAKVALSLGANFPRGSHERVLTAMLCGAVAVTEDSTFYREAFRPGEDLLTFHPARLAPVVERIAALLADPEQRQAIAERGQRAVAAGHTWAARAAELVRIFSGASGDA